MDNEISSSDRMWKYIFEMSVYISTQFSFKEAMEDNKEVIEAYIEKLGIEMLSDEQAHACMISFLEAEQDKWLDRMFGVEPKISKKEFLSKV